MCIGKNLIQEIKSVRLSTCLKSTVAQILIKFDTKTALLKSTLNINSDFLQSVIVGPDSVDGIATRYGLDDPGIESQ
jgi:hypothetical protein